MVAPLSRNDCQASINCYMLTSRSVSTPPGAGPAPLGERLLAPPSAPSGWAPTRRQTPAQMQSRRQAGVQDSTLPKKHSAGVVSQPPPHQLATPSAPNPGSQPRRPEARAVAASLRLGRVCEARRALVQPPRALLAARAGQSTARCGQLSSTPPRMSRRRTASVHNPP